MSHTTATTVEEHSHYLEYYSTGIPNKKLCIWAFLASNSMFFGTLITAHLVYRKTATEPIVVTALLDIPLTAFSTLVLITSSLLMALGVSAIHKGNLKMSRWMLLGTISLGLIFLGFQVYEFTQFIQQKGLTLSSHLFGSTFYLLIGTHVMQVTLGVLWLFGWLVYSFTGKMVPEHAIDVEVAGLYWHFMNIAWAIIFLAAYLLEYM